MDAATIVGYVILNVAILIGCMLLPVLFGTIVLPIILKDTDTIFGGFAVGVFAGIVLSAIGFIVSLIVWAVWLI